VVVTGSLAALSSSAVTAQALASDVVVVATASAVDAGAQEAAAVRAAAQAPGLPVTDTHRQAVQQLFDAARAVGQQ